MTGYSVIDVVSYVQAFSWEKTIRVYWFFIIFDFPRYVLTDVYIFIYEMIRLSRPRKKRKTFESKLLEGPPLVSVLVPVLNAGDTIQWTVRSLLEQTYKNIEIIIVDDGSTDNTPLMCRRLERQEEMVTYSRFEERAGKSAALNHAIRFAKGEFIVFIDADTTFDRDAIFNVIKNFADPKVGAVAGNLRPRNAKRTLLTRLQQIEYLFTIDVGRRIRANFGILPIVSGAFGGFRRELVEQVGGHEPGPGNDSDLTIRIRKRGYKIVFAPDAICLTNVPDKLYNLIKQRMRWDRNLVKTRMLKHRNVFNPFSKNFMIRTTLSFMDTIFFHVVLAFISLIYLMDLSVNYYQIMLFVLAINYLAYFLAEALELIIGAVLTKSWSNLGLFLYLPIYNPYKIMLKLFRVIAYFQELLLRSSTRDPFAPHKVRREMIRW
ncbi:MAG: glycosyltransferase [Candidatus Brocadiales bacterium]